MAPRPLAAFGLALLLITAGCLGAAAPTSAVGASTDDSTTPSVSVAASGSVSVEPDVAVVHIAVESTADSADAARGQVAEDVEAVKAALAAMGVDGDAVTTAYFHLQPEYDHTRESRELIGYRAVHALTIEADVDQAGAVIDAAVGAGAVRVNGVQFTLSDETRQAAREQALADAMDNAAADAGAIADAGGFALDGVRSVATGGPVVYPVQRGVAYAEDAAGGPTSIESGQVTVTASVSVVYDIA